MRALLFFLLQLPTVFAAGPQPAPDRWNASRQIQALKKTPAGTAGGEAAVRFAVLGDSRPEAKWYLYPVYPPGKSNRVFTTLLEEIGRLRPDFTIHTGDIVVHGTAPEYAEIARILDRRANRPFLVAIGNHELTKTPKGKTSSEYEKTFGALDYHFDFRGFRFIMLDTSRYRVSPEQLAWLESLLKTPLRKIVSTHIPPEQIVRPPLVKIGKAFLKNGGEEFTKLMTRYKVERVYLGHLHGFGVVDHEGVRYILSAGAGSPFYPWQRVHRKFHHFILAEADRSGRLTETVYSLDRRERVTPRPLVEFEATDRF